MLSNDSRSPRSQPEEFRHEYSVSKDTKTCAFKVGRCIPTNQSLDVLRSAPLPVMNCRNLCPKQNRTRLPDAENRLKVARGEGAVGLGGKMQG